MPDSDFWGKVAKDRDKALPKTYHLTDEDRELVVEALIHRHEYLRSQRRTNTRLLELVQTVFKKR